MLLVLWILGGLVLLALLILLYGIWIERYLVRFPCVTIPVPNLPPAFDGFTIAHVSDVHLGPLVPAAFLRRLFAKVQRLQPDAIVCTGDYLSGTDVPDRVDAVWDLLDQFHAPHGTYAVLGNCDHRADSARSRARLAASGHDIENRAVSITRDGARFWLAGAPDHITDRAPLDPILAPIPSDDCRILIAHNPDTADTPHDRRIDLILAGHTHGGQLVIPFLGAPILPVHNKAYSAGLLTTPDNTPLFISKGIGWGIFPGRLNCLPEIPLLRLTPAP